MNALAVSITILLNNFIGNFQSFQLRNYLKHVLMYSAPTSTTFNLSCIHMGTSRRPPTSTSILGKSNLFRDVYLYLIQHRTRTSDAFRHKLQIASNVIQSARMLENLSHVLEQKRQQHQYVAVFENDLIQARQLFETALVTYDEDDIFNAEARIEHLTLTHDPMYLEDEEERKRKYFAERDKEEEAPRPPTLVSNVSSRFISLLRGDFHGKQEVSKEDQRSCISKCAWAVALIGLCISLGFLVVDFWYAQANPAISTSVYTNEALTLPVVYACLTIPFVPTFAGLPSTQFEGNALWGMRSFTNVDTNDTLMYPHTRLIVDEKFLGDRYSCEERMQYLSKKSIENAFDNYMQESEKCYSCLRFGARTPIVVERQKAVSRTAGAVTLEFAISKDLEFCFNPYESLNPFLRRNLLDTLTEHAAQLVEREIVVLIDAPSLQYVQYGLEFGFDDYTTAFPDEPHRRLLAQASVICNLYLFSGYFFPVKSGTEIRYSFDMNGGLQSWKRLGNDSDFLDVQSVETVFFSGKITREKILRQMTEEETMGAFKLTDTSINMYVMEKANDPPGTYKDFATSLRQNHRDVLLITEHIDSGQKKYMTSVQLGIRKMFEAVGRFNRFNISLDFATFETEIVTRRPTTSAPEFLTDIFEYVGLFTGVCAYSVLVGPARMYLRRSKQIEKRARGRS